MSAQELRLPRDFSNTLGWAIPKQHQRQTWDAVLDHAELLYYRNRHAVIAAPTAEPEEAA
jgi:hypothetical protein